MGLTRYMSDKSTWWDRDHVRSLTHFARLLLFFFSSWPTCLIIAFLSVSPEYIYYIFQPIQQQPLTNALLSLSLETPSETIFSLRAFFCCLVSFLWLMDTRLLLGLIWPSFSNSYTNATWSIRLLKNGSEKFLLSFFSFSVKECTHSEFFFSQIHRYSKMTCLHVIVN